MSHPIIVIGAGQAALSFIATLREKDEHCEIILIGEEPSLPYQRPPLSKKYLLGELSKERLLLKPDQWYEDNRITLKIEERVEHINRENKHIELTSGETLRYHKLLLATGATPRKLPASIGGDLKGVFTLRNVHDVDQIAPAFTEGANVLIVGGGYIGLEAAAVAAKLGLNVTVIELAERILQRVAAEPTADYFRKLHQTNGVKLLESTGLTALEGDSDNNVSRAVLNDGTTLDVNFVIAGIGVTPNTELAEASGLTVDIGIATNSFGQTSDESIYAAGDCASIDYQGTQVRIESVQNAIDQAKNAALNCAGEPTEYQPDVWFWSDQYQTKLQIAGLNLGHTDTVIRPGQREGAQSVWYYRDEQLISIDAMNDPIAYTLGRRIITSGKNIPKAAAADPSTDLKAYL